MKVDPVISYILQMIKLKHREVNLLKVTLSDRPRI